MNKIAVEFDVVLAKPSSVYKDLPPRAITKGFIRDNFKQGFENQTYSSATGSSCECSKENFFPSSRI